MPSTAERIFRALESSSIFLEEVDSLLKKEDILISLCHKISFKNHGQLLLDKKEILSEIFLLDPRSLKKETKLPWSEALSSEQEIPNFSSLNDLHQSLQNYLDSRRFHWMILFQLCHHASKRSSCYRTMAQKYLKSYLDHTLLETLGDYLDAMVSAISRCSSLSSQRSTGDPSTPAVPSSDNGTSSLKSCSCALLSVSVESLSFLMNSKDKLSHVAHWNTASHTPSYSTTLFQGISKMEDMWKHQFFLELKCILDLLLFVSNSPDHAPVVFGNHQAKRVATSHAPAFNHRLLENFLRLPESWKVQASLKLRFDILLSLIELHYPLPGSDNSTPSSFMIFSVEMAEISRFLPFSSFFLFGVKNAFDGPQDDVVFTSDFGAELKSDLETLLASSESSLVASRISLISLEESRRELDRRWQTAPSSLNTEVPQSHRNTPNGCVSASASSEDDFGVLICSSLISSSSSSFYSSLSSSLEESLHTSCLHTSWFSSYLLHLACHLLLVLRPLDIRTSPAQLPRRFKSSFSTFFMLLDLVFSREPLLLTHFFHFFHSLKRSSESREINSSSCTNSSIFHGEEVSHILIELLQGVLHTPFHAFSLSFFTHLSCTFMQSSTTASIFMDFLLNKPLLVETVLPLSDLRILDRSLLGHQKWKSWNELLLEDSSLELENLFGAQVKRDNVESSWVRFWTSFGEIRRIYEEDVPISCEKGQPETNETQVIVVVEVVWESSTWWEALTWLFQDSALMTSGRFTFELKGLTGNSADMDWSFFSQYYQLCTKLVQFLGQDGLNMVGQAWEVGQGRRRLELLDLGHYWTSWKSLASLHGAGRVPDMMLFLRGGPLLFNNPENGRKGVGVESKGQNVKGDENDDEVDVEMEEGNLTMNHTMPKTTFFTISTPFSNCDGSNGSDDVSFSTLFPERKSLKTWKTNLSNYRHSLRKLWQQMAWEVDQATGVDNFDKAENVHDYNPFQVWLKREGMKDGQEIGNFFSFEGLLESRDLQSRESEAISCGLKLWDRLQNLLEEGFRFPHMMEATFQVSLLAFFNTILSSPTGREWIMPLWRLVPSCASLGLQDHLARDGLPREMDSSRLPVCFFNTTLSTSVAPFLERTLLAGEYEYRRFLAILLSSPLTSFSSRSFIFPWKMKCLFDFWGPYFTTREFMKGLQVLDESALMNSSSPTSLYFLFQQDPDLFKLVNQANPISFSFDEGLQVLEDFHARHSTIATTCTSSYNLVRFIRDMFYEVEGRLETRDLLEDSRRRAFQGMKILLSSYFPLTSFSPVLVSSSTSSLASSSSFSSISRMSSRMLSLQQLFRMNLRPENRGFPSLFQDIYVDTFMQLIQVGGAPLLHSCANPWVGPSSNIFWSLFGGPQGCEILQGLHQGGLASLHFSDISFPSSTSTSMSSVFTAWEKKVHEMSEGNLVPLMQSTVKSMKLFMMIMETVKRRPKFQIPHFITPPTYHAEPSISLSISALDSFWVDQYCSLTSFTSSSSSSISVNALTLLAWVIEIISHSRFQVFQDEVRSVSLAWLGTLLTSFQNHYYRVHGSMFFLSSVLSPETITLFALSLTQALALPPQPLVGSTPSSSSSSSSSLLASSYLFWPLGSSGKSKIHVLSFLDCLVTSQPYSFLALLQATSDLNEEGLKTSTTSTASSSTSNSASSISSSSSSASTKKLSSKFSLEGVLIQLLHDCDQWFVEEPGVLSQFQLLFMHLLNRLNYREIRNFVKKCQENFPRSSSFWEGLLCPLKNIPTWDTTSTSTSSSTPTSSTRATSTTSSSSSSPRKPSSSLMPSLKDLWTSILSSSSLSSSNYLADSLSQVTQVCQQWQCLAQALEIVSQQSQKSPSLPQSLISLPFMQELDSSLHDFVHASMTSYFQQWVEVALDTSSIRQGDCGPGRLVEEMGRLCHYLHISLPALLNSSVRGWTALLDPSSLLPSLAFHAFPTPAPFLFLGWNGSPSSSTTLSLSPSWQEGLKGEYFTPFSSSSSNLLWGGSPDFGPTYFYDSTQLERLVSIFPNAVQKVSGCSSRSTFWVSADPYCQQQAYQAFVLLCLQLPRLNVMGSLLDAQGRVLAALNRFLPATLCNPVGGNVSSAKASTSGANQTSTSTSSSTIGSGSSGSTTASFSSGEKSRKRSSSSASTSLLATDSEDESLLSSTPPASPYHISSSSTTTSATSSSMHGNLNSNSTTTSSNTMSHHSSNSHGNSTPLSSSDRTFHSSSSDSSHPSHFWGEKRSFRVLMEVLQGWKLEATQYFDRSSTSASCTSSCGSSWVPVGGLFAWKSFQVTMTFQRSELFLSMLHHQFRHLQVSENLKKDHFSDQFRNLLQDLTLFYRYFLEIHTISPESCQLERNMNKEISSYRSLVSLTQSRLLTAFLLLFTQLPSEFFVESTSYSKFTSRFLKEFYPLVVHSLLHEVDVHGVKSLGLPYAQMKTEEMLHRDFSSSSSWLPSSFSWKNSSQSSNEECSSSSKSFDCKVEQQQYFYGLLGDVCLRLLRELLGACRNLPMTTKLDIFFLPSLSKCCLETQNNSGLDLNDSREESMGPSLASPEGWKIRSLPDIIDTLRTWKETLSPDISWDEVQKALDYSTWPFPWLGRWYESTSGATSGSTTSTGSGNEERDKRKRFNTSSSFTSTERSASKVFLKTSSSTGPEKIWKPRMKVAGEDGNGSVMSSHMNGESGNNSNSYSRSKSSSTNTTPAATTAVGTLGESSLAYLPIIIDMVDILEETIQCFPSFQTTSSTSPTSIKTTLQYLEPLARAFVHWMDSFLHCPLLTLFQCQLFPSQDSSGVIPSSHPGGCWEGLPFAMGYDGSTWSISYPGQYWSRVLTLLASLGSSTSYWIPERSIGTVNSSLAPTHGGRMVEWSLTFRQKWLDFMVKYFHTLLLPLKGLNLRTFLSFQELLLIRQSLCFFVATFHATSWFTPHSIQESSLASQSLRAHVVTLVQNLCHLLWKISPDSMSSTSSNSSTNTSNAGGVASSGSGAGISGTASSFNSSFPTSSSSTSSTSAAALNSFTHGMKKATSILEESRHISENSHLQQIFALKKIFLPLTRQEKDMNRRLDPSFKQVQATSSSTTTSTSTSSSSFSTPLATSTTTSGSGKSKRRVLMPYSLFFTRCEKQLTSILEVSSDLLLRFTLLEVPELIHFSKPSSLCPFLLSGPLAGEGQEGEVSYPCHTEEDFFRQTLQVGSLVYFTRSLPSQSSSSSSATSGWGASSSSSSSFSSPVNHGYFQRSHEGGANFATSSATSSPWRFPSGGLPRGSSASSTSSSPASFANKAVFLGKVLHIHDGEGAFSCQLQTEDHSLFRVLGSELKSFTLPTFRVQALEDIHVNRYLFFKEFMKRLTSVEEEAGFSLEESQDGGGLAGDSSFTSSTSFSSTSTSSGHSPLKFTSPMKSTLSSTSSSYSSPLNPSVSNSSSSSSTNGASLHDHWVSSAAKLRHVPSSPNTHTTTTTTASSSTSSTSFSGSRMNGGTSSSTTTASSAGAGSTTMGTTASSTSASFFPSTTALFAPSSRHLSSLPSPFLGVGGEPESLSFGFGFHTLAYLASSSTKLRLTFQDEQHAWQLKLSFFKLASLMLLQWRHSLRFLLGGSHWMGWNAVSSSFLHQQLVKLDKLIKDYMDLENLSYGGSRKGKGSTLNQAHLSTSMDNVSNIYDKLFWEVWSTSLKKEMDHLLSLCSETPSNSE